MHHSGHHSKPAPAKDYVLLPQVSGNGYYSYSPSERQYGTAETVAAIVKVAQDRTVLEPRVPIGIGDMSFLGGAPMSPHHSHRDGREVDIRPLRKDQQPGPTNIHDPNYDRTATAVLVGLLLAHPNVHVILFNDATIKGVRHWEGHDNHLHVKMKA